VGGSLGVRWTVGDVSPRGFEALRLSIWGAWRLFGAEAGYVVCVNGIAPEEARGRTGPISAAIGWRVPGEIPDHIRRVLDAGMAEGVAWKFAPLRLFPDRHELALDNDCIVLAMPEALRAWLQGGDRCLIAEGVRLGFGQFPDLCGPEPRNSGIRGLPPGFDLGDALAGVLARPPTKLRSELDEQGLQVAAISRPRPPLVVRVDEVTVCSPFHAHVPNSAAAAPISSSSTFATFLGNIMAGRPTTARPCTGRATARRSIGRSGLELPSPTALHEQPDAKADQR
jgi:hypothetical protein